jgi:hypothetical protein
VWRERREEKCATKDSRVRTTSSHVSSDSSRKKASTQAGAVMEGSSNGSYTGIVSI